MLNIAYRFQMTGDGSSFTFPPTWTAHKSLSIFLRSVTYPTKSVNRMRFLILVLRFPVANCNEYLLYLLLCDYHAINYSLRLFIVVGKADYENILLNLTESFARSSRANRKCLTVTKLCRNLDRRTIGEQMATAGEWGRHYDTVSQKLQCRINCNKNNQCPNRSRHSS
jgi:hypothetical protein